MSTPLHQLTRVYKLREERARKQLRKRRDVLARVSSGLTGASALQAALAARICAPTSDTNCAADLAAHHEHTRQVGQQLKEIERLKMRARANQEQLRGEVRALGMQWSKAQARTAKAESLQREHNDAQQIHAQLDEEAQMLDSWLATHRHAQDEQTASSVSVQSA